MNFAGVKGMPLRRRTQIVDTVTVTKTQPVGVTRGTVELAHNARQRGVTIRIGREDTRLP